MELAARMQRLGTESAFEVLARAKQMEARGRQVIHLEIGEPDFDTPEHVSAAAAEALRAGETHYVPAPGIPSAREAVVAFLERFGRLHTSPDRVVITPGAKPIMWYTILALCDEGDEVLYPDPGFPMYESIAAFAGATPVPLPLREENDFRVDPGELESLVTERTKLLILNSPHNPCGGALTRDDCEAIAEIAFRHDLTVLSDEVYWAIRYDGAHASVLDVDGMADRTVLLDGWSKTFAMTGWRIGYVAAPADLAPIIGLVHRTFNGAVNSAVQKAATVAVTSGSTWPAERLVDYTRRRDLAFAALTDLPGVTVSCPGGAFYLFLRYPQPYSATEMVRHALEYGVGVRAGSEFGPAGEGHIRVAYCVEDQKLEAGLEALRAALTSAP